MSATQNKFVICFDAGSGEVLWKFRAGSKVDASPVIAGDYVVIASSDGRLRLLDLDTGTERWTYEIGSALSGTPAVTNDLVVIGAEDGTVYAFGPAGTK